MALTPASTTAGNMKVLASIERARNILLEDGIESPELFNSINSDAEAVQSIIQRFEQTASGIKNDIYLSKEGKKAQIVVELDKTLNQMAAANKSKQFEKNIEDMKAGLHNEFALQFSSNDRPEESYINRIEDNEMRRYLLNLREQAKSDHEELLADKKKSEAPISDEERAFHDPIAQLWDEACSIYSPEKKSFLQSIIRTKWPIRILPQETIDTGIETLKKTLSPQTAKNLKLTELRLATHQVIHESANDQLVILAAV